jgi:hypothetical protein
MTGEERYEELDAALRALSVHDVTAERADRIRARCLARLRTSGASAPQPGGARRDSNPGVTRLAPVGASAWLETLAALGLSVLYLIMAFQASLVLLRLG